MFRVRTVRRPIDWLITIFGAVAMGGPVSASDKTSLLQLKQLSFQELMDIEVTSVSRRPERRFEATSAIQVITTEDIRRSGAINIPEALRLAPNLHVAQIDTGLWAISARGFNNGLANKQLVLVDGRTIYSPLFAGVFWDIQDTLMQDIDQIEVVSGPGGTVWGSNAVNGVISVKTKSARDTQGLLAEAGGGSEEGSIGNIRYGGELGANVHYRVYAKYTERDSSKLPNGDQWTDDSRSARSGFRMDWQQSAGSAFTLQGDVYELDSGALSTRTLIDAEGFNVLGRWEHAISGTSDFKLQVYYDRAERRNVGTFSDQLELYDLDLQYRFGWNDRHDVILGFGYRQIEDTFVSIVGQAFFPPYLSHGLFNTFLQDTITVIEDRLSLTIGTKLERNDYTGYELQPNIRLALTPNSRQTAWAAISRAVRTPSRFDRDLFIPNRPPFGVVGGPMFRSENLHAYELGYRIQPYERATLDLATFYNDYDDIRSVESVNPPARRPLEIRNGLEGYSYGAELNINLQPAERWSLLLGYRYLDVRLSAEPGSTDTTSVNAEAHDPDHIFLLRSKLDLPGKVQLDTSFRYADRIPTQVVPAYYELDIRLGWRPLPPIELSIIGRNLLQPDHPEFRPLATRHHIERSVFGTLQWGF